MKDMNKQLIKKKEIRCFYMKKDQAYIKKLQIKNVVRPIFIYYIVK